jgi:hypothetical protein
MSVDSDRADKTRSTAEARFKLKEERKTDAEKVWVEINASRKAELAKTDRLRALRLAKEEDDRVAAEAAPKPVKPVRKKKVASASASPKAQTTADSE